MKVHKVLLIAAALALGLVSGCGASGADDSGSEVASAGGSGNGDQKSDTSEGEAPAKDPEERQLQFTSCLRDNGVDIPDSGDGGVRFKANSEADREEMQEAMDACRQYAPGGEEGFRMTEEQKQEMAAYIDCLQKEGVEVSDPDPETGMPTDGEVFMEPDDDTKAAMEACKDKRPDRMMVGGRR